MQHEIFISKQSEGTDFKFDTHSYSSHNKLGVLVLMIKWLYFAGDILFS